MWKTDCPRYIVARGTSYGPCQSPPQHGIEVVVIMFSQIFCKPHWIEWLDAYNSSFPSLPH